MKALTELVGAQRRKPRAKRGALHATKEFPNTVVSVDGVPALRTPRQYARVAESAASVDSGFVTGARIVLWLGSQGSAQSAPALARALNLDTKRIRRALLALTDVGLLTAHTRIVTGTKPVRVYTLRGGSLAAS